jgi:hypothetical protein
MSYIYLGRKKSTFAELCNTYCDLPWMNFKSNYKCFAEIKIYSVPSFFHTNVDFLIYISEDKELHKHFMFYWFTVPWHSV